MRVYESEGKHASPAEIVANRLGYKDARSGSALSAIATLGYYGLLLRNGDGTYAVSPSVEHYKFAPSEAIKAGIAQEWARAPQVFSDLIEKYGDRLPSDETMKFELIQLGFNPEHASACVSSFRRSMDFLTQFETEAVPGAGPIATEAAAVQGAAEGRGGNDINSLSENLDNTLSVTVAPGAALDRVPVRLAGGRRAWVVVPVPFYMRDKERIKRQVDLLFADDEDVGDGDLE